MSQTSSAAVNPELLRFLGGPGSYSHSPEGVEYIQTHISHVFVASPFFYKIKKPVNFEFLDFSTLEKRAYYCRLSESRVLLPAEDGYGQRHVGRGIK